MVQSLRLVGLSLLVLDPVLLFFLKSVESVLMGFGVWCLLPGFLFAVKGNSLNARGFLE